MTTQEKIKEFVYNDKNRFRARYHDVMAGSGSRYWTFKTALNLLLQRGNLKILETGSQRLPADWGAGCSSQVFGDFCSRYGGHLISIDISRENADFCSGLMAELGYSAQHKMICADSVAGMEEIRKAGSGVFGLIVLDSFDFPLGELLEIYGGKTDLDGALAKLKQMTTEEVVTKHGSIILPCQEHCLKEAKVADNLLDRDGLLLIDDTDLAGRGKGRLAIEWLLSNGWEIILEDYQTLFQRRK